MIGDFIFIVLNDVTQYSLYRDDWRGGNNKNLIIIYKLFYATSDVCCNDLLRVAQKFEKENYNATSLTEEG
jgi:hypothetical protein